jgi:hypothetical protein
MLAHILPGSRILLDGALFQHLGSHLRPGCLELLRRAAICCPAPENLGLHVLRLLPLALRFCLGKASYLLSFLGSFGLSALVGLSPELPHPLLPALLLCCLLCLDARARDEVARGP